VDRSGRGAEARGGGRLKEVREAVSGLFVGFQAVAEIQKLSLGRSAVQLVDGSADVSSQELQLEAGHWDGFDVTASLAGEQRLFDLFERVAVTQQQRAFVGCQRNLNGFARRPGELLLS